MEELCEIIRNSVLDRMDFSRELSNEELQEIIARELSENKGVHRLSIQDRVVLEQRIFNSLRKLDVLQELVEDDEITEIMVNGPNNIFYEKCGVFQKHPYSFSSEEKLQDVIQQIVGIVIFILADYTIITKGQQRKKYLEQKQRK